MSKESPEPGDVFKHPSGGVYLVVFHKGELRDVKIYDPFEERRNFNAYLDPVDFLQAPECVYIGSIKELGRRISDEF